MITASYLCIQKVQNHLGVHWSHIFLKGQSSLFHLEYPLYPEFLDILDYPERKINIFHKKSVLNELPTRLAWFVDLEKDYNFIKCYLYIICWNQHDFYSLHRNPGPDPTCQPATLSEKAHKLLQRKVFTLMFIEKGIYWTILKILFIPTPHCTSKSSTWYRQSGHQTWPESSHCMI